MTDAQPRSTAVDHTADPAPADVRLVLLVGLAAGALGGLFGVGGGLIIVPGLTMLVGLERRLAHGTSLAATLPIAVSSLVTYVAHDNVDWAVAGLLTIGAVAGAVLGTKLLAVLPHRTLAVVFIITVLATAIRLVLSSDTGGRADLNLGGAVLLVIIGLAAGTLSGLLGIGGGVVMVPAMIVLFSMLPVVAKGTSVAVIVPTAIMGTLRNRRVANVDLRVAAVAGIAGVITAAVGATIADRLDPAISNAMFAVLLLVVAATQLNSLRERRG